MLEKTVFLLITYFAMLVYDGRKLKQKSKRENLVYGAMMLAAVYLSLDFVLDGDWPNLNDLFNFVFADLAKQIVETIEPPKLPS